MKTEKYLEYFFLNSILNDWLYMGELSQNRPDICTLWYANNTEGKLKLNKVKNRVTELQKELLGNYVIDNNAKA